MHCLTSFAKSLEELEKSLVRGMGLRPQPNFASFAMQRRNLQKRRSTPEPCMEVGLPHEKQLLFIEVRTSPLRSASQRPISRKAKTTHRERKPVQAHIPAHTYTAGILTYPKRTASKALCPPHTHTHTHSMASAAAVPAMQRRWGGEAAHPGLPKRGKGEMGKEGGRGHA